MNYEHPKLLDKLSAEYVLGTMSPRARRRFTRLMQHSPVVQHAVHAWQTRLQPLQQSIVPIDPPAQLWPAIAAQTTALLKQPARATDLPEDSFFMRFQHWFKPSSAFAFGVLIAIGVVLQMPQLFGLQNPSRKLAPSYVGLLTDKSDTPTLAASALRKGNVLSIKILQPLTIPADQVAVLWALPPGTPPVRVSTIPASGKVDIALTSPAETLFAQVAKLGVTYETSANATRPTGDFVLTGHCIKLW